MMDFESIGSVKDVKPIAVGRGIRDLPRLRKQYGQGQWKKLKGFATVCLKDGFVPRKFIGMKRMVSAKKKSN